MPFLFIIIVILFNYLLCFIIYYFFLDLVILIYVNTLCVIVEVFSILMFMLVLEIVFASYDIQQVNVQIFLFLMSSCPLSVLIPLYRMEPNVDLCHFPALFLSF